MKFSRYLTKFIASLILVLSYVLLPKCGFTPFDGTLINHVLYPFSHANVWHLIANIMCIWMVTCRMHIVTAYIVAVLCSFIPSVSLFDCLVNGCVECSKEPTMGFSGVLFVTVGISWGKIRAFRDMIWKNKLYLIIPAFLPHINFLIHIYCIIAGYMVGSLLFSRLKSCVKKYANL